MTAEKKEDDALSCIGPYLAAFAPVLIFVLQGGVTLARLAVSPLLRPVICREERHHPDLWPLQC